MNPNKLIGVLEMGQASTRFYIQLLTEMYSNEHPDRLPPFKLISSEFEAINNLLPNRSAELDAIMASHLKEMHLPGIEAILIPNITIHETVDAVWNSIDSKMAISHPISGTIKRLHQKKKNKAVLFGSAYTMTSNYIKAHFAKAEITIEKPNPKDLQFIDGVRRQVYSESASAETLKQFNDLVQAYSKENPVIIACTELSIASKVRNEYILDMAIIQVEDAISIINNNLG